MAEKNNLRTELGARIRNIRKNKGLTGRDLAEKSKISPTYLSEVERGLSNISGEKLHRIADILRIPLQDLLSPSTQPETNKNVISFPLALSEAADELLLKFSTTVRLFKGANSLVARRSAKQGQEWTKQEWIDFYRSVESILED